MVTDSLEMIVEKLSGLTVRELAQLKSMLEEQWGVTAAAPMVAVAAGPAAAAQEAVAEPTEFEIILDSVPADKKMAVLKVVRELTGLGLKEAKEAVEGTPKSLKSGVGKGEAEEMIKKLHEAGAKATKKGM